MKYVKLLFFLITFGFLNGQAQTHWVIFTDKNGCEFDPYAYFDPLAIERRIAINYDLYDISDFPVNDQYISHVSRLADSVSWSVRWMNALSIWAGGESLELIEQLPFVKEIVPIDQNYTLCGYEDTSDLNNSFILKNQLLVMQGNLFEDMGIDGKGVRMAVFDAGFPQVDTHPAFEHLRKEGRIIKTYDFVRKRDFVYGYNAHGRMVLSVIAGIHEGRRMGLATGAEFLLARTEKNTEPYSEEVNWAAALEWADKNGAHIVNSSLGYTYHRYFPYQMDGQTAFVSRMANTAASKGILVVNAAGNEGDNNWTIIGAPADADSILTVGGINPSTGYKINFSSVGPTSDFRRKPNVSAYGQATVAGKTNLTTAFGTSFASPLVAGFAACTRQIHTDCNAIELKNLIEQSGHLYPYFDYSHGHGVPQASAVLAENYIEPLPTFSVSEQDGQFLIQIDEKQEFDSTVSPYGLYESYLFFAWSDAKGIVSDWGIIRVNQYSLMLQRPSNSSDLTELQLHFRGFTTNLKIQ